MSRSHPFQVEIAVSYRQHSAAGCCAFVTVTETTPRGQIRVLASRHITEADPEALIDTVEALTRSWSLEHYLSSCEPF